MEDFSAAKVYIEICDMIRKFLPSDVDSKEISQSIVFFKRNGRKRILKKHIHSSSFIYNTVGIKDMCGKDCKSIYIILNKYFGKPPSSSYLLNASSAQNSTVSVVDDIFDSHSIDSLDSMIIDEGIEKPDFSASRSSASVSIYLSSIFCLNFFSAV